MAVAERLSGQLDSGLRGREEIRRAMAERFPQFTQTQLDAFSRAMEKRQGRLDEERGVRAVGKYYYDGKEGVWREGETGRFAEKQKPFRDIPDRFETKNHRYVQGYDSRGRQYFRLDGVPIERETFSRSWIQHLSHHEVTERSDRE